MATYTEIMEYINRSASSLFECEMENDILKISTPFCYPDGDEIELFIQMDEKTIFLSDLSETYRYLNSYAMNIANSNKRTKIIKSVVDTYNIRFSNGVFFALIKNKLNILEAVINLSQAIIRVSDLIYTLRESFVGVFREEVMDLLDNKGINYEVNYPVRSEGLSSNYTFDFAIESDKGIRLMNLLSSTKEGRKPIIDSHVKTWLDIDTNMPETFPRQSRITLLDDYSYVWKFRDFQLLTRFSDVYKWTEREKLISKLQQIA